MPELTARTMRSWTTGGLVLLVYLMGVGIGVCTWTIATTKTLFDWQTLIGALTALLAAFIGAVFIHRQIRTAWLIEEDKRVRKLLAARSVLPVALSALTDYAIECGKRLRRLLTHTGSPPSANLLRFPPLPTELIPLFKEIVENAPAEHTVSFRAVVSELQVLNANLSGLRRPSDLAPLNLSSYAARCAYLHALSDMLFPYARFEHDHPARTPGLKELEKALLFFGFHKEHPDAEPAYRLVARRVEKLASR
ncbi:hypothetical protein ACFPOB_22555 [Bosea eneae]|uniref:Uncharacterized protein n=1 Tax=Bosea eneae TaxID=151454 RepID=A0ABW0IVH9_9HYPH